MSKLEVVPDYRLPDEFEAKVLEELSYKSTCFDGMEAELQADIFIEMRPELAPDRTKVIQRIYDLSRQVKTGKTLPKESSHYSPALKSRYGGYEWSAKPWSSRNDTFNFHALNYLKLDTLDVAICECIANHRTNAVAYGFIAEVVGLNRSNVKDRLKKLISRGLIYQTRRGNQAPLYDLVPLWAAVEKSVQQHGIGAERPHLLGRSAPTPGGEAPLQIGAERPTYKN